MAAPYPAAGLSRPLGGQWQGMPGEPPIPRYPGTDRPADPGAEDAAVVDDGDLAPGGQPPPPDDAALPSEMKGHVDPKALRHPDAAPPI
jgi:hypothetical protein